MLVLEGIDRLGKSETAQMIFRLFQRIKPVVDPYGPPPRLLALDASAKDWPVDQYLAVCKPWTVCDRFHFSEYVYGDVLRGKSNLSFVQVACIQKQICEVGGATVTIHQSHGRSGLRRRFKAAGGLQADDPSFAKLEKLAAGFRSIEDQIYSAIAVELPLPEKEADDTLWPADHYGMSIAVQNYINRQVLTKIQTGEHGWLRTIAN